MRRLLPLTVAVYKLICYDSNSPSIGVETIHLVRETRSGPKLLQIAVHRICEVNVLVSEVYGDIIKRVELTTKVVVDKHWKWIS